MRALRQRDRRALWTLGIGVAAYVLLSWVAFPAYRTLHGAESEAVEKESLLRKYRQVVGRKGHYDTLLKEISAQKEEIGTRVIRGANVSLAAAELQTFVENSARKFEIVLLQRTVLPKPPVAGDPLREITMTLTFEGTPQQMMLFLAELRGLPKFVRVLNLNINPLQVMHEAPKGGPFLKNVRVAMTLGAWSESGTAKGGAK